MRGPEKEGDCERAGEGSGVGEVLGREVIVGGAGNGRDGEGERDGVCVGCCLSGMVIWCDVGVV